MLSYRVSIPILFSASSQAYTTVLLESVTIT